MRAVRVWQCLAVCVPGTDDCWLSALELLEDVADDMSSGRSGEEFEMKIFAANDVQHQGLVLGPATGEPGVYLEALYESLQRDLAARPGSPHWTTTRLMAILFPWPEYPAISRDKDKDHFNSYWNDIKALSIRQAHAGPIRRGTPPSNSSSTLLSASQRVYDGEASRRDSINARCSAVLSTAGILSAIVVAAGQLGLMQNKSSLSGIAWIVYFFFVVSLAYVGFSIFTALRVQGGIQGEVVGPEDLHRGSPEGDPNAYNVNIAKTNLLYAMYEWCLNNEFKFRLNSAQTCLRNGIVAIIVAGVMSPWAMHATPTTTGSASPQITSRSAVVQPRVSERATWSLAQSSRPSKYAHLPLGVIRRVRSAVMLAE
jgi:hypothetical protein